jgi:hypothetical protein
VALTFAQAVQAAPPRCDPPSPTGFPLYCRAPVNLATDYGAPVGTSYPNAYLYVGFAKNSVAAGSDLARIPPGTCSWSDRPLNPAEGTQFFVELSHKVYFSAVVKDVILSCNATPNCVFRVQIRSCKDGSFNANLAYNVQTFQVKYKP